MRYSIPITAILFLISSCGQAKGNEIESILLNCLIKNYNEQQVDINKELDKLEKHLIDSKFLKSSSGQSYFDFYQEIVVHNDIPAFLDHDRFDNIYKLAPSQFYSVDCIEELKKLDPTAIANSKFPQMIAAIQKAEEDEISPSNIVKAIISVLSPSDFEKPYYRAAALLAIAYTAQSDIGLESQLFPTDNKDLDSYEILTVSTTEKNQIVLNGNIINQEELKKALIGFIKTNKSNHLIKFQADKGTSYDLYLEVREVFKSVYDDLRNELANEKFNRPYNLLDEREQKEVIEIHPIRIKSRGIYRR